MIRLCHGRRVRITRVDNGVTVNTADKCKVLKLRGCVPGCIEPPAEHIKTMAASQSVFVPPGPGPGTESASGSQVPVMAAPGGTVMYYPQGSGGAGTVIVVSC